jgi:hypothetical protein
MDLEVVGQLAVAALGCAAAAIPLVGRRATKRSHRTHLAADVEILRSLPEDLGMARQKLTAHVEREIDLIATEVDLRRDPFGIGLAISFIALATVGGILIVRAGGYWLWALIGVAFVFSLGAAGLTQDGSLRKRDAKGNPTE